MRGTSGTPAVLRTEEHLPDLHLNKRVCVRLWAALYVTTHTHKKKRLFGLEISAVFIPTDPSLKAWKLRSSALNALLIVPEKASGVDGLTELWNCTRGLCVYRCCRSEHKRRAGAFLWMIRPDKLKMPTFDHRPNAQNSWKDYDWLRDFLLFFQKSEGWKSLRVETSPSPEWIFVQNVIRMWPQVFQTTIKYCLTFIYPIQV